MTYTKKWIDDLTGEVMEMEVPIPKFPKTHKEKLIAAISSNYLSEEVCELLLSLSQPSLNKGDLMRIVYGPDLGGKVDSAYPMDYGNKMRELNPNFRGHFMVYDYNEPNSWGAFENVAERVIIKLQNLINQ